LQYINLENFDSSVAFAFISERTNLELPLDDLRSSALYFLSGCKIQSYFIIKFNILYIHRAFDHMLGFLKHINPDIDGLTGIPSQSAISVRDLECCLLR